MANERFQVDDDLARYAFWRAGPLPNRVGALRERSDGPTVDFVEDELLVDPRDSDLIDELVERYGARVQPEPRVPAPPRELGDGQMHLLETAPPLPLRLIVGDDVTQRSGVGELVASLRDVAPDAATSSPLAAVVAGIVAHYADRTRAPRLNALAVSASTLPMEAPSDTNAGDGQPFQRHRILDAWQLLDSVRTFRSIKPVVWVGVIDGGFWLDPGTGIPVPPDLIGSFGFNLTSQDSRPWGVRGRGENSQGLPTPWHGNDAASAAVGVVNGSGVAGSGGTVARAVMFHGDNLDAGEILYGVKCAYAWGLDVLSISLKVSSWPGSPSSDWEEQFGFADRNRVVVVASAGNDDVRLPDDGRFYPATRTPGVTTVGALTPEGDKKAASSNYGPSVNVWAPGQLTVVGHPDDPHPHEFGGTSAAAPVVAGVAAMMKAVDPGLTSSDARRILHDTGDNGLPSPAQPSLDAVAALWQTLNGAMPADSSEDNDTPTAAAMLTSLAPNVLGPSLAGLASISPGDDDWWRFELPGYTDVRIELRWYRRLGALNLLVTGDGHHATNLAAEQLTVSRDGASSVLTGVLAPGGYRIGLRAGGATVYRLTVTTSPRPLPPDQFEDNDTFDTAARMLLVPPETPLVSVLRQWGPGTYDATLHRVGDRLDVDHYRFSTPESGFFQPTATVSGADFDLTVELIMADGRVVEAHTVAAGTSQEVRLPSDSTCFLRVSGQRETRYRLTTGVSWREGIPQQWEEVQLLPEWWIDPAPDLLHREERSWVVSTRERGADGIVSFVASPGVKVTVRSPAGELAAFEPDESGRLDIDVTAFGEDAVALTARSVDRAKAAFIAQIPPKRMR